MAEPRGSGGRDPHPGRRRVTALGLGLLVAVAGCTGAGTSTAAGSSSPTTAATSRPEPTTESPSPAPELTAPATGSIGPTTAVPSADAGTPLDAASDPAPVPDSWMVEGVLGSVDAARAASPQDLTAAALDLLDRADGIVVEETRDLVAAATADGPVTVGEVGLAREGVSAHLAVLVPDAPREVVLRLLAASPAVGPAVDSLTVRASLDGARLPVRHEPDLDRVVVDLGQPVPGGVVLGLDLNYDLPQGDELANGGGPGAYGLLADHGPVVTLGHWLPAVVSIPDNDGDVPSWGDLGAFDAGTWLIDVASDGGTLRTGGADRLLPDGRQRALGFGLRDLAATWFPDGATPVVGTGEAGPVVLATSADGQHDQTVADLSRAQLAWLATQWTDLPWPELDAVRAPILPAAGMEFPGLIMLDDTFWATDEGPTRFAMVHEWGHQYAHALVGNGSLSDPVVDEPLAQYVSWRWFRAVDGEAAAEQFARDTFSTEGLEVPLEPPGRAAGDFTTAGAYGVAIYRTAAGAWHRAALDHGVDTVDEAVDAVFEQAALQELDEDDLLALVRTVSPPVADDLAVVFDGEDG